jgi:hypothetical protein
VKHDGPEIAVIGDIQQWPGGANADGQPFWLARGSGNMACASAA